MSRPSALAAGLGHYARAEPDRVAFDDGERAVTFEEAYAWAGAIARRLGEQPGSPSGLVPVLVDRTAASATSLLAPFVYGYGVVPIDITDPAARIRDLVGLVRAPVAVVPSAEHASLLPSGCRAVVVSEVGPVPDVDLRPAEPEALALVVFTSGSTGRPKGVVYDHVSLEDTRTRRSLRIAGEEPRGPLLGPLSFLAGFTRVVDTTCGWSTHVFDASRAHPLDIGEWLDRKAFERIAVVPSLARAILAHWPEGRRLAHVRRLNTHGEGLSFADVALLRRIAAPDVTIEPGYASSEAPGVLDFRIGPDDPLGSGTVPLGFPRGDRVVHLEPVDDAPGAPTEIVVHGGVALGYWDDPVLTRARFPVDEEGRRCFRTGDLAVLLPSGALAHAGRVDHLVKIRGKLASPADAERVLSAAPGVREVAVVPEVTASGRRRLVAHVRADTSTSPEALRSLLRRELPAHLVPARLVRHELLPRTSRDKVDRHALGLDGGADWRSRPPRLPVTPNERLVVAAVRDVLELEEASIDDDLWDDLGLDSLAAAELVEVVSAHGVVALDLRDLVGRVSARSLAARLDRRPPERSSVAVDFGPGGAGRSLVCVAGAGGTAAAFRALADGLRPHRRLVVLEAHGMHQVGRPARTVEEAAARFETELERVPGALLAGHSAGGLVAFEMAQRLAARGVVVPVVLVDTGLPGSTAARRMRRPPLLVSRTRSWPVHAAKLVHWRSIVLARKVRAVPTRLRLGRRPVRGPAGYAAFFLLGGRAARRYQPRPAVFPVLVVEAGESDVGRAWAPLVPRLTVVQVPGDHNSVLQHPSASALVDAIERWVASVEVSELGVGVGAGEGDEVVEVDGAEHAVTVDDEDASVG